MKPSLSRCLYYVSTVAPLLLVNSVDAASNISSFTAFELFKNSNFALCPNTSSHPVQVIGLRDATAGSELVSSIWLPKNASYCNFLQGVAVILPTKATQHAFFPWWPTYTLHLFTLGLSFVGLRWTFRAICKKHHSRRQLPVWFWIQLSIDVLRTIAWFFKTLHGFASSDRFAWVSVVMWLLPFAYASLVSSISDARRNVEGVTQFPMASQYQPVHQIEEAPHPTSKEAVSGNSSIPRKSSKPTFAMITLGLVCFIEWCMTFATVVYHFQKPTSPSSRSQEYLLNSTVGADPTTIGSVPQQCVDWLESADLVRMGLFSQYGDQLFSATLAAALFFGTTVAGLGMVLSMAMPRTNGTAQTASRILTLCTSTAVLALVVGVICNVLYDGITLGSKKRYVNLRYTNNPSITGGCSFAFVGMDKRFGYWDVQDELAFRIVMSVLGAS